MGSHDSVIDLSHYSSLNGVCSLYLISSSLCNGEFYKK